MEGEKVEVEVETSESPTAEAAAAAVATAGAAVALAQETAAHAELQAAEEVAEIEEEQDEWRIAHGQALASLSERLSELTSREEERHARLDLLEASHQSILARLEENQAQLLASQVEEQQSEEITTPPDETSTAATQAKEPERVERRRAHRWI